MGAFLRGFYNPEFKFVRILLQGERFQTPFKHRHGDSMKYHLLLLPAAFLLASCLGEAPVSPPSATPDTENPAVTPDETSLDPVFNAPDSVPAATAPNPANPDEPVTGPVVPPVTPPSIPPVTPPSNPPVTPPAPSIAAKRPGNIQFTRVQGLAKQAVSASTGEFFLDTAKRSFSAFFILQNTGDTNVTDITLSTNHPNFTFSPSKIPVLAPSAGASLIQVIKLIVTHGPRIDAAGYGTFLPAGNVEATVTLQGKTLDTNGNIVNVTTSAKMKVFAKKADIEVSSGGVVRNLKTALRGTMNGDVTGYMAQFYVYQELGNGTNPVIVKNSGNVSLPVRVWNHYVSPPTVERSRTLAAGDTLRLDHASYLELDPGDVVTDPEYLPRQASGKVLIGLYP
jgi:hypothetical protein